MFGYPLDPIILKRWRGVRRLTPFFMPKTYLSAIPKKQEILDSVEGPTIYPFTLSPAFQELVTDRYVLVQGSSSLSVFLGLVPSTEVTIKIQASIDGVDFFSFPIINGTSSSIGFNSQVFRLIADASDSNYVFSVPLADVIRYIRVLVSGSGTINFVKVSIR